MFSAIKNYGIAILLVVVALLTALLYRSKAKYESTIRKSSEAARKTEQLSTKAMVKGLNREATARGEISKRIAEFARRKRS